MEGGDGGRRWREGLEYGSRVSCTSLSSNEPSSLLSEFECETKM